ncbi:MAG: antitoxin MazE family protein [Synechococcaceae cyanobacterium]|nr:antitoxin MazE family protein [Synechococcaceae cyanobacterium]
MDAKATSETSRSRASSPSSSGDQSSNAPASAQEARRAANRRKVRQHRQRLRAQGMRPIQIWVPDVHAPEFAAEAQRQCLLANASDDEADIQAFIDSVYEWPDDDDSQ